MMYKKRIKKLQSLSGRLKVLVTDPLDILYYTGFKPSTTAFLVVSSEPSLFVSSLDNEAEGLRHINVLTFSKLEELNLKATVGFDEGMPYSLYKRLSKFARLKPAGSIIKEPRMLKDEGEVKNIRKAIRLGEKALSSLELGGRTEEQVAKDIEALLLSFGSEKSFPPIVGSGKNSYFIHYRPGNRRIRKGDLVIVDLGAKANNYCSDMTRTFYSGRGKMEMKLTEQVAEMQKEVIEKVKAGIKFGDLQRVWKKRMQKSGYKVMHSIGHGIGLEVHERPWKGDRLQENMVITIEPGVYIKGLGGCRIEDIVLVKKNKARVLNRIKQLP